MLWIAALLVAWVVIDAVVVVVMAHLATSRRAPAGSLSPLRSVAAPADGTTAAPSVR